MIALDFVYFYECWGEYNGLERLYGRALAEGERQLGVITHNVDDSS